MKNKSKHFFGAEELAAIESLFNSGNTYRYKEEKGECELFEEEFSTLFGFKKSIQVTSGTNAIVAALLSLEIGPGDEVIIPSYTYIATASAILSVCAIPVVVNIGSDLMISISEIENSINDRTKAIIPVHMDGIQCQIDLIMDLAKKNNLFVIEDVAQAMGGKYKGKYLGTFGDIGCFSLNKDKILSCGEGGIVSTTREDLIEKLLCISDHGYSFNPLHKNKINEITPFLGLSMRVSDISGAIMRVQLKKMEKFLLSYKERKEIYLNAIAEIKEPYSIIEANDKNGDCNSSLHIKCTSPDVAAVLCKKLLSNNIPAIPLAMRPAHCVWKWGNMLGSGASLDDRSNPYSLSDKKYNYNKAFFLDSLEMLMSTIKIEIDITEELEETSKNAEFLAGLVC